MTCTTASAVEGLTSRKEIGEFSRLLVYHGELIDAPLSVLFSGLAQEKGGGGTGSSQTYAPTFQNGQNPPHPAVQWPKTVRSWSEASRFLNAWLLRTLVFSWM
jgi:hypothetical protein